MEEVVLEGAARDPEAYERLAAREESLERGDDGGQAREDDRKPGDVAEEC